MKTTLVRIVVAACILGCPVLAQEAEEGDERARELSERLWDLEVGIGTDYIIGSEIGGPPDSVDISSNRIRLTARGPGWIGSFITASVGYELRLYDWDDGTGFLNGTDEPWETVHQLSTSLTIFQGLSERWGALVRLDARLGAESGADLFDGFSGSLLVGGGYQFTDNFRAGGGIIFIKPLGGRLVAFPGIQLDWQITDQWRFAIEGPGAELSYRLNDEWEFGLGIRANGRRYRLDDDAAGQAGIVQEFRIPAAFRATWTPREDLELTFRAGVDVLRRWRLEDRNGDNDREIEEKPGAFVGVSLSYTF